MLPGRGVLQRRVPQRAPAVALQPVPGQVGVTLLGRRRHQALLHGQGGAADEVGWAADLGSQLVDLAAAVG